MANKENLNRLQSVITNLGIDLGEALVWIYRVFGWQWADTKDKDHDWRPSIPDDKVDMLIDFIRCNYKCRYRYFDYPLHKFMLEKIPEYAREYVAECKINEGKPWRAYFKYAA